MEEPPGQAARQDAPADPAFHACQAAIPAAAQAGAALEQTDATFDAGSEARRATEGRALLPRSTLRAAFAGFGDGHAHHPRLFAADTLVMGEPAILAEGEFDALLLWQ